MNPYLLPSIDKGPPVVMRLLSMIPQAKWDIATDPDRFTMREVIAHLAEWEPIMRGRIEQAVSNPGSIIVAYDEGQMAIDGDYASLDPVEQAAIFVRERTSTAALIRSLTAEQMQCKVSHTERGLLSAEDLANLLLGHDLYHIEQLIELV